MLRGPVGLADYLVAIRQIHAENPQIRRRIAELLGIVEPQSSVPPFPVLPARPITDTRTIRRPEKPVDRSKLQLSGEPTTPTREAPVNIADLDATAVDLSWPTDLPRGPVTDDPSDPRRAAPPLIPPRQERRIVEALLASKRMGNELDLPRLEADLVQLRLDATLPTLAEVSVHSGADLLVDVSDALAPYFDDIDRLFTLAEHIGGDAARILYFEHCPGRGVFNEELEAAPFRSEHPRTVVVGAFGAAPMQLSAGPDEWLASIQSLRLDSEVIGVCPFEAGCTQFAPIIPMVSWSESTNTTTVRRAMEAHRWSTSTR